MSQSRPVRAWLYDGVGQAWFSADAIRDFLTHWLPWLDIGVRGDLLAGGPAEALAERLCRIRVLDPAREAGQRPRRPLKPELDYEARILAGALRASSGVVYDGHELQGVAGELLPSRERTQEAVHIWFTERLIATWDEDNRRYHARVSLYGQPSVVSTSGMVQAPARDRQFYLARRLGVARGREDRSGFLDHEDPRTTELAKGYAMQALFYSLTGEPFCEEPRCRLFNAHWQREMLAAQLEGDDFCRRHAELIESWRPQQPTERK